MKRTGYIFIGLIGLLLSMSGCDYTDALLKDGKMTEKELAVEAFDRVVIETSVRLVLANDQEYAARAKGLDFILPRLVLEQNGKTLVVDSEGMIGFRKKQMPELILSSPDLKRIISNFPAEITTLDTLNIEQLSIVINGRGTFTQCNMLVDAGQISLSAYGSNAGNHIFRGKAGKLHVVAEGLSSVDASELEAKEVKYVQRSVNDGYMWATEKLFVNMLSSGDIFYYGEPDTTIQMGEPLYEVELGEVIHLK
jgi:hypothetical protein